jgi:hypothetical protein
MEYGVLVLLFLLFAASSLLGLGRHGHPRPFWVCWGVFMFGTFFFLLALGLWWIGAALLLPLGLLYGIVYCALRESPQEDPLPPEEISS